MPVGQFNWHVFCSFLLHTTVVLVPDHGKEGPPISDISDAEKRAKAIAKGKKIIPGFFALCGLDGCVLYV